MVKVNRHSFIPTKKGLGEASAVEGVKTAVGYIEEWQRCKNCLNFGNTGNLQKYVKPFRCEANTFWFPVELGPGCVGNKERSLK